LVLVQIFHSNIGRKEREEMVFGLLNVIKCY
jgi:hypothetical protein